MSIAFGDSENLSPQELSQLENGLRILARIIARAYRADMQKGAAEHNQLKAKLSTPELPAKMNEKLALSVSEVAKALGTSNSTVYAAVRQGQIPVIKWGKRILIPRIALVKMLNEAKPHIG